MNFLCVATECALVQFDSISVSTWIVSVFPVCVSWAVPLGRLYSFIESYSDIGIAVACRSQAPLTRPMGPMII